MARTLLAAMIATTGLLLASFACDDGAAVKETLPGPRVEPTPAPSSDAGPALPDSGTKDCFDNPRTHFEIINACTNATRIAKNPSLPRLLLDGGLPPLN